MSQSGINTLERRNEVPIKITSPPNETEHIKATIIAIGSDTGSEVTNVQSHSQGEKTTPSFFEYVRKERNLKVLYEMLTIFNECRTKGWDGYDANPLDTNSLKNTFDFILDLPLDAEPPEIMPDPNGTFMLHWENDEQSLALNVDGNRVISFGAISSNGGEVYGATPFTLSIPRNIVNEILLFSEPNES